MAQENTSTTKPNAVVTQATGGAMPPHTSTTKQKQLIAAVVLLVVIAIGLGIYIYHKHHHTTTTSDNQTYSRLTSYSVAGASAGSTMSFNLPQAFTKLTFKDNALVGNQAVFLEQSAASTHLTIGGARAGSTAYSSAQKPTAAFLTAYNAVIKSDTSQVVQGQKALAYPLLTPSFPKQVIAIYSLKGFTSSNVKADAWVASFIVAAGGVPKTAKKTQIYQGQLFYATTKNASYHFLFYTTPSNWTNSANQKVWPQVLDSIKLDQ